MLWFAVRTVYHFGNKADGTHIFEERIVGFCAFSFDEAFEKGLKESDRYIAGGRIAAHPDREIYEQDGDELIDGYELWSVLFQSTESLEEFYANRYERCEYYPDP